LIEPRAYESRLQEELDDLTRAVGVFLEARPGPEQREALEVLIQSYDVTMEQSNKRSALARKRRDKYMQVEREQRASGQVKPARYIRRLDRTIEKSRRLRQRRKVVDETES
jgi:hypothetical protein